MTGLVLLLAMATGQDCPGGSCASPSGGFFSRLAGRGPIARSFVNERPGAQELNERRYVRPSTISEGDADYTVEVQSRRGDSTGYGSGTVLRMLGGRALVITCAHEFRQPGNVVVIDRAGTARPGTLLARSTRYDLAAIETETPPAVTGRLIAGGNDPSRPWQLAMCSVPPDEVQIAGYGPGKHDLIAQSGQRVSGNQDINGDDVPDGCCIYRVNPRRGDSGGSAFHETGFAGVVTHVTAEGGGGVVFGPAAIKDFLYRECAEIRRFTLCPFFIKWRRDRTDAPQTARQPTYQPDPGVSVNAPGVGVQVGPTAPPQVVQGPQGLQGPAGINGTNGKDADPAALAALTNQINTLTTNMGKLAGAVQAIQNQPPPAQGPIGATGATGANGKDADPAVLTALTKAVTALQNQSIYIQFQTPNGPSQTQQFTLKTDPSGNLFYAIQLNPTSLAPTTVPVTPLPSTSSK